MRKAGMKMLTAQAAILLGAAGVTFAGHPAVAIAVLFLLPVIAEAARAWGMRFLGAGLAAVVCSASCLAGQPEQVAQLACLWFVGALLMDCQSRLNTVFKRTAGWLAWTVAVLCVSVVMLRQHYAGTVCLGLARDVAAIVDDHEQANSILLAAYQMGYARLEGEMAAVPALRLFGRTVIVPQVRTELLNSLRTTLYYLLTEQLPAWLVYYLGATLVLTSALPEAIRRRREEAVLPPLHRWHMSREMAIGAALLALFGLTRYLTGSLSVYQAAGMCNAAFCMAYGLQGLCLALWWLRKGHYQGWGVAIAALALSMLPLAAMVLVVLGAVDQFADPRGLREKDDIEGG